MNQRYKNSKEEGKTLRGKVRVLEQEVEDLKQEVENLKQEMKKNKTILTHWQVATALMEGIVEFYILKKLYLLSYITNIGLAQKIWFSMSDEDKGHLEEKIIFDSKLLFFYII